MKHAQKPPARRAARGELRALALKHAGKALEKLVALIDSKNERVALSAAQMVLDRAHGKVSQAMSLKAPEGGLTVKILRFKQGDGDAE